MIISRTPFRISFVGGGTDLPSFYRQGGFGSVLSTAINKYMYVTISEKFDGRVHLRYAETEHVDRVNRLKHDVIRECLRRVGIKSGIEIVTISDIPATGTGLGASSALAVGTLHAAYAYTGRMHITAQELAQEAFEIETQLLDAPIGKQDHYATAYGGTNVFRFLSDETIEVENLNHRLDSHLKRLEETCLLYFIGIPRSASKILAGLKTRLQEIEGSCEAYTLLEDSLHDVDMMRKFLQTGHDVQMLGHLLDRSWERKKVLTPQATNSEIDQMYATGKEHGAVGAKVCGAGGGGFMLYAVPPENQPKFRREMKKTYKEMRFTLETRGTSILSR